MLQGCLLLQMSVRNCFIRGSVVRYVQVSYAGMPLQKLFSVETAHSLMTQQSLVDCICSCHQTVWISKSFMMPQGGKLGEHNPGNEGMRRAEEGVSMPANGTISSESHSSMRRADEGVSIPANGTISSGSHSSIYTLLAHMLYRLLFSCFC